MFNGELEEMGKNEKEWERKGAVASTISSFGEKGKPCAGVQPCKYVPSSGHCHGCHLALRYVGKSASYAYTHTHIYKHSIHYPEYTTGRFTHTYLGAASGKGIVVEVV